MSDKLKDFLKIIGIAFLSQLMIGIFGLIKWALS